MANFYDLYKIDFARKHAAMCAYSVNFGGGSGIRDRLSGAYDSAKSFLGDAYEGAKDFVGDRAIPAIRTGLDKAGYFLESTGKKVTPFMMKGYDAVASGPNANLYRGMLGGAGLGAGLGALLAARNGVNGTRGRRAAWGALGGAGLGILGGTLGGAYLDKYLAGKKLNQQNNIAQGNAYLNEGFAK